ncbi:O-antigen ligase family protein [Nonomuraea ferruginea]|uniref:O-antigen ligase family protein n=1 Tax=Nonomuraea ferruginea TaxID=46174 RepID=A0ABT4SPZ9_9ACTN|nr:O-antigen ligase family protein [Nonomuraea ferruginea]MDA0639316.1 O-antigen ligase family protein [Nonomuraea ferruginea]
MTETRDRTADPALGPPDRDGRADGATVAAVFAFVLLVVPARLVLKYLPLSLTPANVVSLVAALLWLCAQLTLALGAAKGRNPVRTALFAYFTAMLATYGFATAGPMESDELNLADHSFVLVVAIVGLALTVCDGVRGLRRLDFVLKTLVVAGAVIAVIGALQFLFSIDLTRFMELPILRYTTEGDAFVLERADLRRVAATTGHPIEFGVTCAMLLPLAVHYGVRARALREPSLRWWACALLIGCGLMFSVSRSAMLSLAVVGVVLFAGWPVRRRLQALVAAAGFLVAVRIAVPGLLGTFVGLFTDLGNDESIQYRTHDYAVAAQQISRHFWLGRGLGTWYAPKHQIFDNQYILSMVETGLIGTAAFAGLFLVACYAALRSRFLSADPVTRDLGLTVAACLVVPLAGSFTFDLLSFHTVTGISFLLVGAAGALLRAVRADQLAPSQASGPTIEVTR